MSVNQTFLDDLRSALNHLYDPEFLRTSPLAERLRLETRGSSGSKLQQTLLEAIEALRPHAGEPASSAQRRIYSILQLRYEQQFAQQEVAAQLGLSVRQYRRIQQTALQTLADYLWERCGLAERLGAAGGDEPLADEGEEGDEAAQAWPESLRWVEALAPDEISSLAQVLPDTLRLLEPLAQRHGKSLRLTGDLSAQVTIHPLVLRQIVLHLVNTAVLRDANPAVDIRVRSETLHAIIDIRSEGPAAIEQRAGERATGERGTGAQPAGDGDFAMVQRLARAYGAAVKVGPAPRGWTAELRCQRTEPRPILVVDDHRDTIDLLKRYLVGTRYRIAATTDPQRAPELAAELQPYLILLDVMMPGTDGWEVLTRLKQQEATAAIPVWVCTVLDQSELAVSLGAGGFLRKPVTRQKLLVVLDSYVADQEPARR